MLAAMPGELRTLARALRLRRGVLASGPGWRGRDAAGRALLAAAVGVGPAAAGARAGALLDELRPLRVVVTGVAGALDPAFSIGDVLAPDAVVDAANGARYVPHRRTTSHGRPARGGTLVTVHVLGQELPAGLAEEAACVDMETAAIAAACEARGVPWDVRRAVSDLPGAAGPELMGLLRPDGRVRPLAAAALVLRGPRAARRLARLGLDSRRAVAAATRAVLDDVGPAAAGG